MSGLRAQPTRVAHPLLGARTGGDSDVVTYASTLSAAYLGDHIVGGEAIFPAAGYVELGLAMAEDLGLAPAIYDLAIHAPLRVGTNVRVTAERAGDRWRATLASEAGQVHATLALSATTAIGGATLATARPVGANTAVGEAARPTAVPARGGVPVSVEGLYGDIAAAGLAYGPAFRGLQRVRVLGETVLADVALPASAPSAGLSPAPRAAGRRVPGSERAASRPGRGPRAGADGGRPRVAVRDGGPRR